MSKLLNFKTNRQNYYQILDNKKPCLSITSKNFYFQENNFLNKKNKALGDNISYNTYNYIVKKYNKNIILDNNILKKIAIERAIESGFIY